MARPPKSTTSPDTLTRTARPKATTKVLEKPAADDASAPSASPLGDNAASSADETMVRPALRLPTPPEARNNTLAAAITRPALEHQSPPATDRATMILPSEDVETPPVTPRGTRDHTPPAPDDIADEIADEVDGWSAADQPTIYLPPKSYLLQRATFQAPNDLPAPRPKAAGTTPAPRPVPPTNAPGRAAPPPAAPTYAFGQERLAAPDGRIAPQVPPPGVPRAALANPRMERFQELRQRRTSMDPEQREAPSGRPVAEVVRQWWGDLLPGVERALQHQHAAHASGVHPLPAHSETVVGRLGDAFGRLSQSARAITERTQAVVAPTLRRLHDEAEQRAQALVERVEGGPARQQAPLLGPGRIAVFFHNGVTVSQAQASLGANHARPIRLIPRKHGFLAVVRPGTEEETAERLRDDPQVRDVAYLEFDEFGHPIDPR